MQREIMSRTLEAEDIPFMFKLLSRKEVSDKLHWNPNLNEIEECYEQYWSKDSDEKNFVICLGSSTIGWIKLNGYEGEDELWISMLVIDPDYSGRGYGHKVLEFAEKQAVINQRRILGVETTVDNLTAIALYIKYGFKLKKYVSEDQRYIFYKAINN